MTHAGTLPTGRALRARPDLTALPRIGIAAAIAVFLVVRDLSPGASPSEYWPVVSFASVALLLVSGIVQMLTTVWSSHRLAFFVVGAAAVGMFLVLAGFDARSYGLLLFWLVAELALLLEKPVVLGVWSAAAAGYVLNEIWIAPGLADDRLAMQVLATVSVSLAAGSLTAAALAMRSAQKEREVANRLRELDDMKNMFLQAVSHELRTPLASVMGYAMLLGTRGEEMPAEKRKVASQGILEGARKLDRLLADLLDVDRLRRGIIKPRRTSIDLATLVRRVLVETPLGDHPVEVELPSTVVDVDGPKIERVVENLLTNAAKYSPDGSTITVSLCRSGDSVELSVADRGAGVPDRMKTTIFDVFERGAEMRPEKPGVGIGLALVSSFAELHGGRAKVADRPGGGSVFTVVLPASEDGVEPQ